MALKAWIVFFWWLAFQRKNILSPFSGWMMEAVCSFRMSVTSYKPA
jgi:hypothetical protein